MACLANPLAEDEVICAVDPVEKKGYRHKATGLGVAPAPEDGTPIPLSIQLADGSLWRLRSGGAASTNVEGQIPTYWCDGVGCTDGEALWGDAMTVNDSTGVPMAGRGTADEAPQGVDVAKAWFVGP